MTLQQRYLVELKKQENLGFVWELRIKIGIMLLVIGLFLFPVFFPVAAFTSILPAFLGAWLALAGATTLLVNPAVSILMKVGQLIAQKMFIKEKCNVMEQTLQFSMTLLNTANTSSCSAEIAMKQDRIEDEITTLQNNLKRVKNKEALAPFLMEVRNLLRRTLQALPSYALENIDFFEKLNSFRSFIPNYDAIEEIKDLLPRKSQFCASSLYRLLRFKSQDLVGVSPSTSFDSLHDLILIDDDEDCDESSSLDISTSCGL